MKVLFSKIYSESELFLIIKEFFYPLLKEYNIFLLEGPLGVGKTTFVRNFLLSYGIKNVISPTFSYVHTYDLKDFSIHHFDLYRIKSQKDFVDLGFCEYIFNEKNIVLIEWPEVIKLLLLDSKITKKVLKINIFYLSQVLNKRCIQFYF